MADYQVTGFVFGAGGGTPGPAYGWVKSYTIGGTTYQFAPEAAAAAAPPAADSAGLEAYIATNSIDVPGSTADFTPTGTSNTDLSKIDSTKPLNGTYDNWQDPTDSFVDVYSYSTAELVGTFPVVGSKVFLVNADVSSLAAGKHYLVFQGQTSGAVGIVQFDVIALAATGSEYAFVIAVTAISLLALGLWFVLYTASARWREAWCAGTPGPGHPVASGSGMQGGVQEDALAGALQHLHRPGERVAPEQQSVAAGERLGLHGRERAGCRGGGIRHDDLRAGGHVEAGLHDAVVAEGDADAGVRAEQRALADRHALCAAAAQRSHDRGAAADVGAVPDDDALRDAALHHRGAEGSGVEVHEALVHDGRAGGEVGAEPHAVRIRDAHARRHDVVDEPRELVDRGNLSTE
jgi:hypothetical protein